MDQKDRIEFEVVKHYGVIGEARGGWIKELNLVAWNGRDPKFDVRDWSPDHEKMGKGITLSQEEAAKLAEMLKKALT
ncbi:MAG: PC4/YdbC family ssDNA-binding protein [Treponema sp.]|nr:PC4/YdbC family ssDNA-binding protein [Treponema sp.]